MFKCEIKNKSQIKAFIINLYSFKQINTNKAFLI